MRLEQLNRIEEMVSNLITMQATNNAKLEDLTERMDHMTDRVDQMSEEIREVKDTLHTFRSETGMALIKMDRQIRLIEGDLDATMLKVELSATKI